MPVTKIVGCASMARREAVAPTPTALTSSNRTGPSISGVPQSRTWSMTVHQATLNALALRDAAASAAPKCSNAHCRARSVRQVRGAIASRVSIQVLVSHYACEQHQMRFHQHTTTARPPMGKSGTQVGRRSLARATALQPSNQIRGGLHSTSSSPVTSTVVTTPNPSSPTTQHPTTQWSPSSSRAPSPRDRFVVTTELCRARSSAHPVSAASPDPRTCPRFSAKSLWPGKGSSG